VRLRAWRIVKAKHALSAFDGEGARRFGSRWTSAGVRVVFTSETLSLATLEILVHLQSSSILTSYVTFSVEFPEEVVQDLDHTRLPKDWRSSPPSLPTQMIGEEWVKTASSAILKVPSAVIVHEHNYLMNPLHPDFSKLLISPPRPLDIDPRLAGVGGGKSKTALP
jgi:RES domain-containing protein